MFRRFSENYAIQSILIDSICIVLALYLATHLRPLIQWPPWVAQLDMPLKVPPWLYLVFVAIWIWVFLLYAIYDCRRNYRITNALASVTLGSFLASIALAGVVYFAYRGMSRVLFVTFCALAYVMVVTWRIGARLIFRLQNGNGKQSRSLLIIGAGLVGHDLERKISRRVSHAVKLVGFLDDDPEKQRRDASVLGPLDQVRAIVQRHQVDDIILAMPLRAYAKVNQLVTELHDLPVKIWVVPDYFHLALNEAVIAEFAGIPMVDLRAPALNEYQRMIKRWFDLVICVLLMPLALPLMGVIALAIWLDDPGPVLFRQTRVGENGCTFEMLKFRTMVVGADKMRHLVEKRDEHGNLIHKCDDDPRVTRVGRFLRRTSLDELPQFFNVLKGEMSLIGPRPEMPYLVEKYEPWQRTRFAVPQGITGWWQVNGRSDKPMHLHTEDDIYYVQNYSIWLDLYILIKTVWVVIRREGAY
jgi:exopolysaccharide biosynthesis polyprenyl glycosylphosphotransferase